MKLESVRDVTMAITVLYGVLVMAIAKVWPEAYTPVMWVVPGFFYIYEVVFLWLLGRYKQMKADKVLTTSMIMRGVKFIGVAALMVVYVKLGLAGKIHFLLYTLIYYILTSACETWLVKAYNQTKGKE
ncbi:MAG: hypothetical protein IJF01_07945 [Tidjanibacter sp.]|nr:hypothetical protein [Tidjanibacter sp.]